MANILIITHIYPPAIDGGSKVIFKLGKYLSQQHNSLLVITSNCRSTDDFSHQYQPIKTSFDKDIVRLPVYTSFHRLFKLLSRYLPIFTVLKTGPIFKFIPFFQSLIKIIKFKPDYIIAGPLPTTIILYSQFIKYLTKALTFHRSKVLINASFHPTDKDFHNPILISCLKSCDYLWTLTDFETNYFEKNFNIPKTKMINVGNGVDSSFLSNTLTFQRSKALTLLYIGSFAAHKGIETLLDAFTIISKDPKFYRSNVPKLILAGQPTLYSPIIEAKIESLPPIIKSNIKIIYNFPPVKLSDLIDSSSVLILPSNQESFGLVLIEAMARYKPVIASDIPSLSELVSKSGGGLLFKPGNSKDLASTIMKIYGNKSLSISLGKNGFNYVQANYTWDKIGKTIWQKISSSQSA